MHEVSRRSFLKVSSGALAGMGISAAVTGPRIVTAQAAAPSEKIRVGFIGVAGRGNNLIDAFSAQPDVEMTAMCDLYPPHLEKALARANGKAKGYQDFRALLEDKNVDAVAIATPPHWHAIIAIAACQAGKDVYCEKPMSLKPVETRAVREAARKYNRISQVGTQIHADENYHRVVEIVRSGILGPISHIRTELMLNEAPNGITGNPADSNPPEGLDWDMWCGPLPLMPFNQAKFTMHRYFAELVGSWLHEMGPHIIDLPVWAMDMKAPKAVSASGGKFVTKDISTIPDTMEVIFEYPEYIMTWSNKCGNSIGGPFRGKGGRQLGTTFSGLNAALMADYGKMEVIAEDGKEEPKLPEPSLKRSPGHQREFLDSVKSRVQPSCSFDYHYNVHIPLHLGNYAMKLGRRLVWDDEKGEVVGDKEANEAMQANYRAPWTLTV